MEIPISHSVPDNFEEDLIIDGIFGFSFSGEIRPPFDSIIHVQFESTTEFT